MADEPPILDDPRLGVETPDFTQIGKGVAVGFDEAGLLYKLLTGGKRGFIDSSRTIFGLIIKSFGWIAGQVIRSIATTTRAMDPAFGEIAKAALEALFDVPVSSGALLDLTNHGGREDLRQSIGHSMLGVLTGLSGGAGSTDIAPSFGPAERYLGTIANFAIEGWLMDIMVEAESLGYLEHFGTLKDTVAEMFGFGRLTRRILGPAIDVLIKDPMLWQVNKTYRPKMLTAPEAIKHFYRGHLDESEMLEVLARDGYGDRAIEALLFSERKYLSPADADLLARAGVWTRGDAIQELRDSGHEADRAERLLQLEELKLIRKFQTELADAAMLAFVDHRIDEITFDQAIDAAGLDTTTTDRIRELAHQRHIVNVRHVSRAEAELAVEKLVWSESQYRDYLDAQGYGLDDAITLELLLHVRLNEQADAARRKTAIAAERAAAKAAATQAAEAKRAQLARIHADFTGTIAQAERLVVRGLMGEDTYRQILIDHGYSAADAGELAQLAQQDADAYANAQDKKRQLAAKSHAPEISLAALEDAVKRGVLSMSAFASELDTRGFNAEDAALLTALLTNEIATLKAAQQKRDEIAARLATTKLSLGTIETAVRKGVATMDNYRAALAAYGLSAPDQATLVALLQSHLADDQVAQRKRDAAAVALAASHLSLVQEEQAVRDGIKTLDDYRGLLAAHGFSADDQATLVALLEEQLADDRAAAAAHASASGTLAGKGLSLSEIDAATIAGVLTLDAYRAFLTRLGFDSTDVETLVAILEPKVTAAAAAREQRDALELAPGEKGVTLQQFRKAVLAGVSTIGEYDTFLIGQGYADADRQQLVETLDAELATKQAAAQKTAAAAGKLATKNLSLPQIQQAVKDGLRSIDDYAALLAQQGFSPEDVTILVAELQAQLAPPAGG